MPEADKADAPVLDFNSPAILASASRRLTSLWWRIAHTALFVAAASLALGSAEGALFWFSAIGLTTLLDYAAAKRYVNSNEPRARARDGALFVASIAVGSLALSAMIITVAIEGGAPGRALALLIAASVLMGAMLFLFRSPVFMLVMAGAPAICLLLTPFLPNVESSTPAWAGALGLALGIAAFLSYLWRAAVSTDGIISGLGEALREADARRLEADEANKAKSAFMMTMTHELRTPLNAVIGYAEIISEDAEAARQDSIAKDASTIRSSARHLLSIIDQILCISELENGDAAMVAFDLEKTIVTVIDESARANPSGLNGNTVNRFVATDIGVVELHKATLELCLAQLLSNAIKFTQNGHINVRVHRQQTMENNWLEIVVSDTGIGMSAALVGKAFEPFAQLDGSATREHGGIGLGLTIAARAAAQLQGTLSVESKLGEGSQFSLRIPLRDTPTFEDATASTA
jgi:signal transduction histidine kinase